MALFGMRQIPVLTRCQIFIPSSSSICGRGMQYFSLVSSLNQHSSFPASTQLENFSRALKKNDVGVQNDKSVVRRIDREIEKFEKKIVPAPVGSGISGDSRDVLVHDFLRCGPRDEPHSRENLLDDLALLLRVTSRLRE